MKSFFRSVYQGVRNIAFKINRGYNAVKHFVRKNSARVKEVAGIVRDASKYFESLPYIGDAAKIIGGVAAGVDKGVDMVNRGMDKMEEWQRYSGAPTHNTPQVNPLFGQSFVPVTVR